MIFSCLWPRSIDTTNNRAVVSDGSTAGGWPAAKLAEVITNTRVAVSDAAYSVQTSDRMVAYAALTAARVVTLPAASAYPTGTPLMIVDETGSCSASKTITVNRAGSDLIDGAASFVLGAAYAGLEIESNGANAWTILSPRPNLQASLVGVGTTPDPNNVLSAYGVSALFNSAGNFNLTINKGAAADTASLLFEDGFSGRAQMGLAGSDNFSFKVSSNGSSWTTAIALDATTGAATFANQRTPVADAAYAAQVTDRLIAYTALTAARTVTLPAAASYPQGQQLTLADESGACSATKTILVARAGSDTINGAASASIAAAYGYLALESNGSNGWTVIDSGGGFVGDAGSGGYAGMVPAPAAGSAASNEVLGAGGAWVGQMASSRNRLRNPSFAVNQRGVSGTVTLAAGAYGHDGVKAGASGATYTFSTSGLDTTLNINAGSLILPIEAANVEGGSYVLSQAGSAQARVWQGTGSTGSGAYASAPFVAGGLTAATQTNVEFSTGTLLRPQFEPGTIVSAATAFERRRYDAELAFCRYYTRPFGAGAVGQTASTTSCNVLGRIDPPMHGSPSASLGGFTGATTTINQFGAASVTITALAGSVTTSGLALLELTVTGGVVNSFAGGVAGDIALLTAEI